MNNVVVNVRRRKSS